MGRRPHDRESEPRVPRSLPSRSRTESRRSSSGPPMPSVNDLGSAKEFVGGLKDDAAETDRVILLRCEKIADGLGDVAGVVAAERGVHPVFREEGVAGALDVAKHAQGRFNVFFG